MDESVSDIIAIEPVIVEPDDETKWTECTLEWSEEYEAFINKDSKEEWFLDEHARLDSKYIVEGEEYSSLDRAIREALGDRSDEFDSQPTVFHHYRL